MNFHSRTVIQSGWLCLVCTFLLAACVSRPYPPGWAPLLDTGAGDCAGLAGSYDNFGVWDDGDRVVMASLFFPLRFNEPQMLNYERLAVTRVTLALTPGSELDVRGWVEDELLFERRLPAADIECRGNSLAIRDSGWHFDGVAPFLPVLARNSTERLLTLASDGALVMENNELSAGAVVVVPVAVKSRYWFRFEPSPTQRTAAEARALPGGVRQQAPAAEVLLGPAGAPNWSGYQRAQDCLAQSRAGGEGDEAERSQVPAGLDSQSFLLQGRDGDLLPHGVVRGSDWYPASHELRLAKQHRQAPELADRYLLCLLEKGYRRDVLGGH